MGEIEFPEALVAASPVRALVKKSGAPVRCCATHSRTCSPHPARHAARDFQMQSRSESALVRSTQIVARASDDVSVAKRARHGLLEALGEVLWP